MIVHPRDLTEAAFQLIEYKCVPVMRVNRNIRKECRMLPSMLQGLELPNINIGVLCSNIYCVKNHWGEQYVTGNQLLCTLGNTYPRLASSHSFIYRLYLASLLVVSTVIIIPFDSVAFVLEVWTHQFSKLDTHDVALEPTSQIIE